MIGRLPVSARVGLALILVAAAWFGGWFYWWRSRNWVPLDETVSTPAQLTWTLQQDGRVVNRGLGDANRRCRTASTARLFVAEQDYVRWNGAR